MKLLTVPMRNKPIEIESELLLEDTQRILSSKNIINVKTATIFVPNGVCEIEIEGVEIHEFNENSLTLVIPDNLDNDLTSKFTKWEGFIINKHELHIVNGGRICEECSLVSTSIACRAIID